MDDATGCPQCLMYLSGQLGLTEACGLIDDAQGLPAGVTLRDYLTVYHRNGHREVEA